MSIEITDEKKREAMDALGRALDVAMYQTLAARIPECGTFGAIAQDLDFAFPILAAALSPAPQALAGEAETQTTVGIGRDGKIFWTREGDMRVHAREQAERIEKLEATLAKARERIEMARLLTDTGAVSLGKTMDYSPSAVEAILRHLDTALTVLAEGGRDNG